VSQLEDLNHVKSCRLIQQQQQVAEFSNFPALMHVAADCTQAAWLSTFCIRIRFNQALFSLSAVACQFYQALAFTDKNIHTHREPKEKAEQTHVRNSKFGHCY